MEENTIAQSGDANALALLKSIVHTHGSDPDLIDELASELVRATLEGMDVNDHEKILIYEGCKDYLVSVYLGRITSTASTALRKRAWKVKQSHSWRYTRIPITNISTGAITYLSFTTFESWLDSVARDAGIPESDTRAIRLATQDGGLLWQSQQGKLLDKNGEDVKAGELIGLPNEVFGEIASIASASTNQKAVNTVVQEALAGESKAAIRKTAIKQGLIATKIRLHCFTVPAATGPGTAYLFVPESENEENYFLKAFEARMSFEDIAPMEILSKLGQVE